MTALREQVMAVPIPTRVDDRLTIADVIRQDRLRVLVVFAERERAIRAEYAPDVSPGDVIHAEPDGTIVLDDGITTWNPSRAVAFLLAERGRLLRERIEALPRDYGYVRLSKVLAVFDAQQERYDEPMIGGPHEVENQYHSEPDRDPRQ